LTAGLSSGAPAWKYPTTRATERCSVIALILASAMPCRPASVTNPDRRLWPPKSPSHPASRARRRTTRPPAAGDSASNRRRRPHIQPQRH